MRLASPLRAAPIATRFVGAAVVVTLSLTVPSITSRAEAQTTYPVGIVNLDEPSGMSPPPTSAMTGYHLSYLNDFNASGIPRGWYPFTGLAGGDPTDRFSAHHVLVTQGVMRLKTYPDPTNANRWTTAGVCQCGQSFTYGAVFVRSRETGAGVNSAELLWPSNNRWPPEIDFNESLYMIKLTTSTVHWAGNKTDFHILKINMLKWHTWGVIWTHNYILFTVDGHPWHEFSVPASIPHEAMNVDFEQRVRCPSVTSCPVQPSALQVDWIAEYRPA